MNLTQQLLIILIEECNETSQRATKALRFGMEEMQPGQDQTNANRLLYEFNDIVAVVKILQEIGQLETNPALDAEAIRLKTEKVKKYLSYSEQLGILKGNNTGYIETNILICNICSNKMDEGYDGNKIGSDCPICKKGTLHKMSTPPVLLVDKNDGQYRFGGVDEKPMYDPIEAAKVRYEAAVHLYKALFAEVPMDGITGKRVLQDIINEMAKLSKDFEIIRKQK